MSEKTDRLARSLRPGLNAHRLVAQTAIEMAQELFEVYAQENAVYAALRQRGEIAEKQARARFIKRVAPKLLEDARNTLTSMLGKPDDQVAPSMKEEIYEALISDNALRANRLVAKGRATVPATVH